MYTAYTRKYGIFILCNIYPNIKIVLYMDVLIIIYCKDIIVIILNVSVLLKAEKHNCDNCFNCPPLVLHSYV